MVTYSIQTLIVADATVKVIQQEETKLTVPVEVAFKSTDGNDANYRFMLADVVNQQMKDIKFKGAEFEVNIVPTAKNLKDLGYFNGILGRLKQRSRLRLTALT